ncbi:MAG: hypothetical protein RH949_16375 [Coleofasciculus sp. A1-SPW-01]|uniref:hypothetical protein n=1 Tax=Coleofasciculus sp. A1-SPW-01 TaxID=3070819 RepID=UPI0032F4F52C
MDTAQAFLDQCLILSSFLAEPAFNYVGAIALADFIPPNPFGLGILAVYNLTQVQQVLPSLCSLPTLSLYHKIYKYLKEPNQKFNRCSEQDIAYFFQWHPSSNTISTSPSRVSPGECSSTGIHGKMTVSS